MRDGRGWRFAVEVAFLVALAVVLGAAEVRSGLIVVVMLVGWVLVALLEWAAWREEPHWGSGSPPRYYVPPAALPPRRAVEQGYPAQREAESPTWIATPEMRAAALGEWPVARPAQEDSAPGADAGPARVDGALLAPEARPKGASEDQPVEPAAAEQPAPVREEAVVGAAADPGPEPEAQSEVEPQPEPEPLAEALLHEAAAVTTLEDAPVELEEPGSNGSDPWESVPADAARMLGGGRPSRHRIDPLVEPAARRWWRRAEDGGEGPSAEFPALPRHAPVPFRDPEER